MNAEQFYNAIRNAEMRPTLQQAEADVNQAVSKYQASSCYRPRRLVVSVSDLGTQKVIRCRCGKCDYCRDYQREEWVTRMWHETKHGFKNAYVVSLHYRGFPSYGAVPEFLRNAYYHYDALNSTGSELWHPCLLRIEHFQLFIQNLRRKFHIKLKYYVAAEYGGEYGRPHFHVLIWTDQDLNPYMIHECWSINVGGRKFPNLVSIGNFDFQDLNTNGTVVDTLSIDGKQYNAKNCFKYLCKYLNKSADANFSRVDLFRKDLLENFFTYKNQEYVDVFKDVKKWLLRFYPLSEADGFDDFTCKRLLFSYVYKLASEGLSSFSVLFNCFTSCSRADGIGSVYIRANLERMASGDLHIEKAPFGRLICPRFYLRKVKDVINPYLRHSQLSGSLSFSAQNRPYQVEALKSVLNAPFSDPIDKTLYKDIDPFSLDPGSLSKLLNSEFAWKDSVSCKRFLIYNKPSVSGDLSDVRVGFWNYDRHHREYVFSHDMSLSWFVEQYEQSCKKSYDLTAKLFENIDTDLSLLAAADDIIDCIYDSDQSWYNDFFLPNVETAFGFKYSGVCSPHEVIFNNHVDLLERKNKQFAKDKYDKFNPKID